MESHPAIRIAAAVITRPDGNTLLVRKHGTTAFMQPGGKIDPGETPLTALLRELQEELGLTIAPSQPVYLGRFTAPAANEPGHMVDAEIYRIEITSSVIPATEIAETAWLNPNQAQNLKLAALTQTLLCQFSMSGGE